MRVVGANTARDGEYFVRIHLGTGSEQLGIRSLLDVEWITEE